MDLSTLLREQKDRGTRYIRLRLSGKSGPHSYYKPDKSKTPFFLLLPLALLEGTQEIDPASLLYSLDRHQDVDECPPIT